MRFKTAGAPAAAIAARTIAAVAVRTTAMVAVAMLTACSGGGVATQSYSYRADVPGHEQYAATLGPTPVAVYNSPYATADVIAAMQGRNPGPKLTFVAAQESGTTYRLVMVFGESTAAPSTYCEATAVAAAPSPSGRLVVTAAFCSGKAIISDAVARTGAIASTQDPRFADVMSQLLSALLPRTAEPGIGDGETGGSSGGM